MTRYLTRLNRECQTKDWKVHKNHCAKVKYDPQIFASLKDQFPGRFIGCPSSAPGYVRTPALERQIFFLSHPHSLNQNSDYHVSILMFRYFVSMYILTFCCSISLDPSVLERSYSRIALVSYLLSFVVYFHSHVRSSQIRLPCRSSSRNDFWFNICGPQDAYNHRRL